MSETHDQERSYKYKPDGCWSWVVCVASFTSLTIVNGYCMTWGVLLPAVIDHFNATRAQTGRYSIQNTRPTECHWSVTDLGKYVTNNRNTDSIRLLSALNRFSNVFLLSQKRVKIYYFDRSLLKKRLETRIRLHSAYSTLSSITRLVLFQTTCILYIGSKSVWFSPYTLH